MKYEILPTPQQHQHYLYQQQHTHHGHLHHHHSHRSEEQHQQYQQQLQYQQHYLTIEDLKLTRNSCWLCGCNWLEDHVSLDCPECGGYALTRPCPSCDGKCNQTWTRNISATHDRHKALWIGQCNLKLN
uniref:Protein pinocchio n=1 Tax=Aceria tosichella TaxID=561515 RepID=A0A6G1S651_9ACAR